MTAPQTDTPPLGLGPRAMHRGVVLGNLLLAVIAAHVAAALWHHLVMKDATLWRMLPR